ncbi:MAG: TetR/AcrR family transcriptional regulator [Christensenellaceae bacterium]
MEQREIQQTFIRSAIRVIAQKGLVKATTKAIAADAGLNEAYIYKCFKGKDELLAEALHDRDEGLAVFLRREFPNVLAETSPWRDRCFHLWEKTWKFILDKRDDCIFYLRYYSSPRLLRLRARPAAAILPRADPARRIPFPPRDGSGYAHASGV